MNKRDSQAQDAKAQGPEDNTQQISADIDRTRSVISGDIQELSQKLDPDRLKQQAKEALGEATEHLKGEAREAVVEAKEAVVEKFRDVKDAALESVSETYHDVEDTVLHAGDVTWTFAKRNAVPLVLLGVGAAWLFGSNRSGSSSKARRSRPTGPRRGYNGNGRGVADNASAGLSRGAAAVRSAASHVGEDVQAFGERAEHAVKDGATRARDFAEHEWDRARSISGDLIRDNPLAVGAVVMAAGVGVGLLLPTTEKENRLLGAGRDRLVDEARDVAHELSNAAKETARDVKDGLVSAHSAE